MAFVYNNIILTSDQLNVNIEGDGTSTTATAIIPGSLLTPLRADGIGFPIALSITPNLDGISFTSIAFDFSTGVLKFSLASAPASGQTGTITVVYGYIAQP